MKPVRTYELMPQGEHLERFPGDRHTEEDRDFFDQRVGELVGQMPESNAREVAAREMLAAKRARKAG